MEQTKRSPRARPAGEIFNLLNFFRFVIMVMTDGRIKGIVKMVLNFSIELNNVFAFCKVSFRNQGNFKTRPRSNQPI